VLSGIGSDTEDGYDGHHHLMMYVGDFLWWGGEERGGATRRYSMVLFLCFILYVNVYNEAEEFIKCRKNILYV